MTEQNPSDVAKEQEKALKSAEDNEKIKTLEEGKKLDEKLQKKDEKEESKKPERAAIVYIYSSKNNTIIHVTDMAGNTLTRVSGGMVTKHSRLKSDPTIAMFAAKRVAERIRDLGVTSIYIRTRAQTNSMGFGSGGHSAVKTLGKEGLRIISILDTTRVPRGGPKKKGGKRGRRV
jgi:small subunit ribosomal protein S11